MAESPPKVRLCSSNQAAIFSLGMSLAWWKSWSKKPGLAMPNTNCSKSSGSSIAAPKACMMLASLISSFPQIMPSTVSGLRIETTSTAAF
ncbi:S8 family serine peptidase [Rhodoferax sp.]|uniref:S8 family serine peptidase n=1 Tax=Rhodoferax sp. TaxID=50421 RepID=UPI003BB4E848